jgi:hypothetical protein
MNEAYTGDYSSATGPDHARAIVIGGFFPFGTFADDMAEPEYPDMLIEQIQRGHEDPVRFILEIGSLMP